MTLTENKRLAQAWWDGPLNAIKAKRYKETRFNPEVVVLTKQFRDGPRVEILEDGFNFSQGNIFKGCETTEELFKASDLFFK